VGMVVGGAGAVWVAGGEGKECNAPKGFTSFLVTTLVSAQVSCVQANGPGNYSRKSFWKSAGKVECEVA
jgi:hypothetical protein